MQSFVPFLPSFPWFKPLNISGIVGRPACIVGYRIHLPVF
jgi:hypothetical protein